MREVKMKKKKSAKLTLQRRRAYAVLSILHKNTSFNVGQRRRADAVIITFWDTPTLYSYSVGAPTL